jgi:hypothetical protein
VLSDISLGTLRVDGVLKFATNTNVRIKLDTLVVTPTGTFEVGAELARVPSTKKVEIVIGNNGPIDRAWDPSNISRGIILQGKTRIYGSNKSAFHELSVAPAVGSTQIQLASTPVGWVRGDIVAITAVKFRYKNPTDTSYQTGDELKRIKAISGTTVTLGSVSNSDIVEPLQYSHVPTIANMPVYAANLTRNVEFSGEGGDAIPTSQRGHFMVMHSPDTIIKGTGFYHLGRSDKSIPLNDFKLDVNGFRIKDTQGNYIKDSNTNPRGRYAVHFHHTGVDPTVAPVICSGNAVISSPGWGFVNHTSNVLMQNNASYNVLGSHFVTEDGNELGVFRHNIAIKSSGRTNTGNTSGFKSGIGNHDHGHSAHGFWFQNRNIVVEDNVVSGTYGAGMIYYSRNFISGINLYIPKENLIIEDKSIVKDKPSIYFQDIPITHLNKLTVLASDTALVVVKDNNNQGHDARNILQSVKGYSVLNGARLEYLSKYTLIDFEMVADITSNGWHRGIDVSRNDRDIAVINAKIDGFIHPILTGTIFNGFPDQTDVVFVNVLVNGRTFNPQGDIHKFVYLPVSNYDPAYHQVYNTLPATSGTLGFIPSKSASYDLPAQLTGFTVKGAKTDSLGVKAIESKWIDVSLVANIVKGYYTRSDGSKFIILSEPIADRLTGQTVTINTRANIVHYYPYLGPHLGQLSN